MQAMQRYDATIKFQIFTTVPEWFFADQRLNNFEYIPSLHDVGFTQLTPFEEDLPSTLSRLDGIFPYSSDLIKNTVDQLKKSTADLVICDIAPLGIVAARQLGIPSLLIENFTWDWLYQPFSDAYPQFSEYIDHLKSLFPLATYHIQAEPICERIGNVPKVNEPISRTFFTQPELVRNQLGIHEKEKMVLVSFGGIREQFGQLDLFHHYANTVFVIGGISDTSQRYHNVITLQHNSPFYHPDLIQAADIIIGKAGYSTLAEVSLAGKPFAFISREKNIESAVLAKHILGHIPSIEISQQAYLQQKWIDRIPEILTLKPNKAAKINGADLVTEFIFSEIL